MWLPEKLWPRYGTYSSPRVETNACNPKTQEVEAKRTKRLRASWTTLDLVSKNKIKQEQMLWYTALIPVLRRQKRGLWVHSQPVHTCKFQASQGDTMRSCLKIKAMGRNYRERALKVYVAVDSGLVWDFFGWLFFVLFCFQYKALCLSMESICTYKKKHLLQKGVC